MKIDKNVKEVLFTPQQIAERVAQMAAEISSDFKDKKLLVIGVLKGASVFMCDLVRALEMDVEMDFVQSSSYGNGTNSSGKVKLLKDFSTNCAGRDVLLVEDIIDSGVTLNHLKELLLRRNAASVTIATMLSKPSRRVVDVEVKYIGFEIPDKFVVGYGMDFAENYRGLPSICVLG